MAALTADFTLANSAWTQVSTSKATVVITNTSTIPLRYAVAAADTDLANVTGHQINRNETVKLNDLGSNNVFIKSDNTGGGAKAAVSAY
jgi:hypothetical protein